MPRTTTRVTAALVALTALGGAVASAAQAAPARSGKVAIGSPYAWDGASISGLGVGSETACLAPGSCDETLVDVAAGQVTISIGSASQGAVDLDLYVYASDASGKVGDQVASQADGDSDESVTFLAGSAGPYLVRVVGATALMGTYKGTASVEKGVAAVTPTGATVASTGPNAPGAAAPPAPTVIFTDPDPSTGTPGSGTAGGGTSAGTDVPGVNDAPFARVKAPPSRGTRVLSGTAADPDGKIARVRVAVVRLAAKQGGRCTQLASVKPSFAKLASCTKPTIFLTANGHVIWSVRLKAALPKGRYVAYARATDTAGLTQSGFKGTSRRAFTVR
ncbi:hypothetical protein DSM112329_04019 [Paraconexibacter sp. AEG42_29]|uniref:Peptidase C-terminal archaeal/bacterial domain-containing protein n=1 Tax=Paraconexibacter sp. AEG42_29 TaxID=2997339 RepID=A0AAU7AZS3_9ACTN